MPVVAVGSAGLVRTCWRCVRPCLTASAGTFWVVGHWLEPTGAIGRRLPDHHAVLVVRCCDMFMLTRGQWAPLKRVIW